MPPRLPALSTPRSPLVFGLALRVGVAGEGDASGWKILVRIEAGLMGLGMPVSRDGRLEVLSGCRRRSGHGFRLLLQPHASAQTLPMNPSPSTCMEWTPPTRRRSAATAR